MLFQKMFSVKFKTSYCLVLVMMCIFHVHSGMAQSQEKVYSLLMINLARGILWPDSKVSDNFIIGVLGYPPLAAELNAASETNKIGTRKVQVKEFVRIEEIEKCHIIFVPSYKAKMLAGVLNQVGTESTLIVTNTIDFSKKGSGVNFVLVDGKLKYEINCKSIEKRGMKISSNVKGMGIVVE